MNDETIISVKNLKTFFYTNQRCNKAVNGVSFQIKKGTTLCIVGESGCGKSVTASSIMQLLPRLSRIESGEIVYNSPEGKIRIDRLKKNGKKMRALRGADIAMIFQDPMTALNPVYTVGFQIGENLIYHRSMKKRQARAQAVKTLKEMGIPLPEQRVNEYPHQYSGGMRQRAMIAMAMACRPKVLIADEPTTALDVTIQAQIFELIEALKRVHNTAVLLITHDMGVVTELADDVAVMYMGNIVESGTVEDVLRTPAHPYTKALLKSIPVIGRGKDQAIEPIRGSTPDPFNRPQGCQFHPRCDHMSDRCLTMPDDHNINTTHAVRCWHYEKVLQNGDT
ncbi:peptide ABC transporter ATP-binding protein [candidate division KSB3 bacterium]|uniref:Peptide ABC transporter ATP-binding protein n=1 Tax=candidate division KSB3 bacterium TaxID=2044937 RepID=A0A2G6E2F9_9BACT|nr:MAG: peptide ABC transporter ATP-binding protein [candidate division KSB3 bacterium]PIE28750.1 MAG: peptide ABC transporter ATP-binding protein [candidate division KSB3 bacterium]